MSILTTLYICRSGLILLDFEFHSSTWPNPFHPHHCLFFVHKKILKLMYFRKSGRDKVKCISQVPDPLSSLQWESFTGMTNHGSNCIHAQNVPKKGTFAVTAFQLGQPSAVEERLHQLSLFPLILSFTAIHIFTHSLNILSIPTPLSMEGLFSICLLLVFVVIFFCTQPCDHSTKIVDCTRRISL